MIRRNGVSEPLMGCCFNWLKRIGPYWVIKDEGECCVFWNDSRALTRVEETRVVTSSWPPPADFSSSSLLLLLLSFLRPYDKNRRDILESETRELFQMERAIKPRRNGGIFWKSCFSKSWERRWCRQTVRLRARRTTSSTTRCYFSSSPSAQHFGSGWRSRRGHYLTIRLQFFHSIFFLGERKRSG